MKAGLRLDTASMGKKRVKADGRLTASKLYMQIEAKLWHLQLTCGR